MHDEKALIGLPLNAHLLMSFWFLVVLVQGLASGLRCGTAGPGRDWSCTS